MEKFDAKELLASLSEPLGDRAEVPESDGALLRCSSPKEHETLGEVHCDGEWHRVESGVTGRCPRRICEERSSRVGSERLRLSGELMRLTRPYGFSGFDPDRSGLKGGQRALWVMQQFSAGRPPLNNVLLKGPHGLGKTHLLLASHFELMAGGIASQYVTTHELRRLFKRAENFDAEIANEAQGKLDRFIYAQVVHFDDAGETENDQRARGLFAEGLKDLLDRSRGKWAVSTNRSADEATEHPDMTAAIVSRMLHNCELVEMSGVDYRATTARREMLP